MFSTQGWSDHGTEDSGWGPGWHWSCSGLCIVITITAWSHSGLTHWRNSGLLTLCWAHWAQPWLPAPGVARLRPETSPGQEQLTMGRPGQWVVRPAQPAQDNSKTRAGGGAHHSTWHYSIPSSSWVHKPQPGPLTNKCRERETLHAAPPSPLPLDNPRTRSSDSTPEMKWEISAPLGYAERGAAAVCSASGAKLEKLNN